MKRCLVLVLAAVVLSGCATARHAVINASPLPPEAREFLLSEDVTVLFGAVDYGLEEYAFAKLEGVDDQGAKNIAKVGADEYVQEVVGVNLVALCERVFNVGSAKLINASPDSAAYIRSDLRMLRSRLVRLFGDEMATWLPITTGSDLE